MLRTLSRILAPRRRLLRRRQQIVEDFHRLYFNDVFDKRLRANWLGVELLKYPADLIVYQEIIHEIRPDLIVETGTHHGGSGHTKQHVAQEIDIYRHFVTKGSYLIADRSRERFPLTSNPNGFLLRIA
jgi:cephalosporin hydroxylase